MNVLNELTNAPSPVGNQNYDSNGNLLTNHVGAHSKWVYFYDDENRLIELICTNSISDIKATDFIYDGLGRLRKRLEYVPTPGQSPVGNWMLSSETRYIYDGWRVTQERDGNNTPAVSYTRGNDLSVSLEGVGGIGGLLARSAGYSSGNWTSHADYYSDGNGNVTSLIDDSQTVVASYRYDPFGNIISKSGTLADANVYRFSSKEVHVASGTYYYGFRFYDPNLQRWINRDPIGERGGVNLESLNRNDLINFVDRFGLSLVCNKTGSPLVVSGNPGSGRGKGGQLFAVVPPGETGGGKNAIPGYDTRQEALEAYYDPDYDPDRTLSSGNICDIDGIDVPGNHPSDQHADIKTSGDEEGPVVTVSPGPLPGTVSITSDPIGWLGALARTLAPIFQGPLLPGRR